jgi:uncharacterized protein (TIGR03437 family)
VIIGGFQYTPAGSQIGFGRAADNISYQAQSNTVPFTSVGPNCAATVDSDSPWLSVSGSNVIPAGLSLRYNVTANLGGARSGNLVLQSTNCNSTPGAQVLTVTQSGLVCSPAFASQSTHLGFLQSVFSVLIRGTDPACGWTVQSSAGWLRITSAASGAGDGSINLAADGNSEALLRGAVLQLNNGPIHSVYQDAAGSSLALSPAVAYGCGGAFAKFGLSWAAPSNIELHTNLPDGPAIGAFGSTGTTILPNVADGTRIFMVQAAGTPGGSTVLASARASVLPDCGLPSVAPLGVVNGASYAAGSLAPETFASIFGSNLSGGVAQASAGAYPTSLGGVTVTLAGKACPLSYVSPGQINFLVPPNIAPGRYTVNAGTASSEILIAGVSPGLFTVRGDGTGAPLAALTAVLDDGGTASLTPYQCSAGGCGPAPMAMPANATDLYIALYGTGIRNYRNISAGLGNERPEVAYVGANAQFPGLDQVNLHLKAPFHLSGTLALALLVDAAPSNPVTLQFQ